MKLQKAFFQRDVLDVARELPGKVIVRKFKDGTIKKYVITETEAYRGEEDLACHASKGRTKRTETMYQEGGCIYVYLIYGMYWMLNFVCGKNNEPQAVLIRCIEGLNGPGKTGRELKIDKSFNEEKIYLSDRIYIEDHGGKNKITTDKRVGIDYAGDLWKNKKWRFILKKTI